MSVAMQNASIDPTEAIATSQDLQRILMDFRINLKPKDIKYLQNKFELLPTHKRDLTNVMKYLNYNKQHQQWNLKIPQRLNAVNLKQYAAPAEANLAVSRA